MPKTFAALQRDVASFVKMPDDSEVLSIAGSGLNDGINNLVNSKNWSWQMSTSGFNLVDGTNAYNVPTDFKQERNLSLVNVAGEIGRRVGRGDPKIFDTRFQHGTQSSAQGGTPHYYTITDPYPSGVIRFNVVPDTNTVTMYPTIELMYYARVPELAGSTDTLQVPPEVESMILWYAKSYVAAMFAHDQVTYAESRWRPLLTQLKRNESNRQDWDL